MGGNVSGILTFLGGAFVGFVLDKVFEYLMKKCGGIKEAYLRRVTGKYAKTIASDEYVTFQNKVLEIYYGEEQFTEVMGEKFPVYIFEGSKCTYPFEELYNKEELVFDRKVDYKNSIYYKKYKKVIGHNIRRPDMQGFMLNKLSLDEEGKVKKINAWVGTYAENVYTSHILEYEIYRLYTKFKSRNLNDTKICNTIKKKMILRNKIHNGYTNLEVLSSGCNRASLLGVQMIVLIKEKDTNYKVLTIKRSEKVAAKPGFYQFIPSGGFEVFENSDEHNEYDLKQNFSIINAIFREYIEELFGKEDFEYGQGGETVNKVINYPEIKVITNMIKEGKAKLEFLGSVIDLVGLRNELSFVLRIDDENYSEVIFKSNDESKKIERYPINEIETIIQDKKKINPPSAALWHLLEKSHLFKEINNR